MTKRNFESSIPTPSEDDLNEKQRLSQQNQTREVDAVSRTNFAGTPSTQSVYKGLLGASDPVVPSDLQAPNAQRAQCGWTDKYDWRSNRIVAANRLS